MAKKISSEIISEITLLRQQGWSLPELKEKYAVGYGTLYRYMKDIEILPNYKSLWMGKRGDSKKRMLIAQQKAEEKATQDIKSLTHIEKIIFLSALYWGEGSKSDFGLSNTDPNLIQIFIQGLQECFSVSKDRLRISIRIYEDMDKDKCLEFWSSVTGVQKENFVSVTILKGKKDGKLLYGMCRVRVLKAGDLLKYILAIKNNVVKQFIAPVA